MRTLRTLLIASTLAHATTALAIDRLVPSQYATIQSAIDAATAGDRVMVSAGFYPERIDLKGKAIVLKATAGAARTSLSPNGQRGAIITCTSSETSASAVEGFTILGSLDPAIDINGTSPVFRNCTFSQNNAERGAAVNFRGTGGSPRFENCKFFANHANLEGGAIYASTSNGVIEFQSCDFSGNDATGYAGGAIRSESVSTVRLFSCNFLSNSVTRNEGCVGGAIYSDGSLVIDSCHFSGNVVRSSGTYGSPAGGAIGATGAIVVSSTLFETNEASASGSYATARGGAVWLTGEQVATFLDSNFRLNRSVRSVSTGSSIGGAVSLSGGRDPAFTACTFSGNEVFSPNNSSFGGTLHHEGGCNGILIDCVIEDSTAQLQGGAIFLSDNAYPRLAGCSIRRCSTSDVNGAGGAVYARPGANAYLDNTVFANCSSIRGGALFTVSARAFINGCSFNSNSAVTSGGAVFTEGSGVTFVPAIQNSIFCGNGINDISGAWTNISPGSNTFLVNCGDDCNQNGVPDPIDITAGTEEDCNGNSRPDSCDIADNTAADCDNNGVPDSCDPDCDGDGLPDACESDCDSDGIPDACEISQGAADSDLDGVPDSCELATSDRNRDGVLDSCQTLEFTGLRTEIIPITASRLTIPTGAVCYRVWAEVATPQARVYGFYGDPDHEMRIQAQGGFFQSTPGGNLSTQLSCAAGGASAFDSWLTIGKTCADGNSVESAGLDFGAFNLGGALSTRNGIVFTEPDAAQCLGGSARSVLLMQITTTQPVAPSGSMCLIGENSDGSNWQAFGMTIPAPTLTDCNGNGHQDAFDIADGTSSDANMNGVPDECECMGDVDHDGDVNVLDIVEVLLAWGEIGPNPADVDQDGVVGTGDLSLILLFFGGC